MEDQIDMAFETPARRGKGEAEVFYDAVLFLRAHGKRRVIRANGSQTLVDGRLIDNRNVAILARSLGWRSKEY